MPGTAEPGTTHSTRNRHTRNRNARKQHGGFSLIYKEIKGVLIYIYNVQK